MAVAKELVVDALKELRNTSGLKLADKLIVDLADNLKDLIETDDDVKAAIESPTIQVLLKAAIKEGDRRATLAQPKAQPADPAKPETPAEQAPSDPTEALRKQVETLTGLVTTMVQGQKAKTLQDRFRSDDRVKNLPEDFFEGRYPTTEEEFDQKADRMADVFKDYGQFRSAQEGSKGSGTPATPPTGSVKKTQKASDNELDALLPSIGGAAAPTPAK